MTTEGTGAATGIEGSLRALINVAEKQAVLLFIKEQSLAKDFPTKPGVYLIREKNGKIMYVGKAKQLHRRINDDHISGDLDMGTSTFRRKLARAHTELLPGPAMRVWVVSNCTFSFIEITDPDMCNIVEAVAIAIARTQNPDLLNS